MGERSPSSLCLWLNVGGAALTCVTPISSGWSLPRKQRTALLYESIVNPRLRLWSQPHDCITWSIGINTCCGEDKNVKHCVHIQLYKEKFGFPIVMGLSNISFWKSYNVHIWMVNFEQWPRLNNPIENPLNYPAKKLSLYLVQLLVDPGSAQFIKAIYMKMNRAPGVTCPKGPEKTFWQQWSISWIFALV